MWIGHQVDAGFLRDCKGGHAKLLISSFLSQVSLQGLGYETGRSSPDACLDIIGSCLLMDGPGSCSLG